MTGVLAPAARRCSTMERSRVAYSATGTCCLSLHAAQCMVSRNAAIAPASCAATHDNAHRNSQSAHKFMELRDIKAKATTQAPLLQWVVRMWNQRGAAAEPRKPHLQPPLRAASLAPKNMVISAGPLASDTGNIRCSRCPAHTVLYPEYPLSTTSACRTTSVTQIIVHAARKFLHPAPGTRHPSNKVLKRIAPSGHTAQPVGRPIRLQGHDSDHEL